MNVSRRQMRVVFHDHARVRMLLLGQSINAGSLRSVELLDATTNSTVPARQSGTGSAIEGVICTQLIPYSFRIKRHGVL